DPAAFQRHERVAAADSAIEHALIEDLGRAARFVSPHGGGRRKRLRLARDVTPVIHGDRYVTFAPKATQARAAMREVVFQPGFGKHLLDDAYGTGAYAIGERGELRQLLPVRFRIA